MQFKKRAGSVSSGLASGQTTPGTTNGGKSAGKQRVLDEDDLQRADEALSQRELTACACRGTLD